MDHAGSILLVTIHGISGDDGSLVVVELSQQRLQQLQNSSKVIIIGVNAQRMAGYSSLWLPRSSRRNVRYSVRMSTQVFHLAGRQNIQSELR